LVTSPLSREERNHRTLMAASNLEGLGRRAVHGTMITFSAHSARMIITVAGSAILARLLAPQDFGLIAMATTVTAFVGLFSDLGLSAATVQRQQITHGLVSTLLTLNLIAGVVLMALAAVLAPVSAWLFGDPRLTLLTICLSLSIPVTAMGTQHGALLGRAMRWVPAQAATLFGQVVGLICAILAIHFWHISYWGLVVQQMTGALASTALLWRACDWRPTLMLDWQGATSEIRFGVGITSFSFINYFHRQLDNILIGWRWHAAELGHYNRAYNLFSALQSFSSLPLNSVLMPLLSRSKSDPAQWRINFLNAATIIAFGNGLIGTIFVCCGSALVYILYGPHWGKAAAILFCLSPTILISGNFALGTIFMARGDSRGILRSAILNVSLYVTGFLLALDRGSVAMATAYSVVTAMTVPLTVYLALKDDVVAQAEYYRATLPFTLCGAIVISAWLWLIPDGNAPTPFLWLAIRATALGGSYLLLASAVLLLDPAQAPLRARVAGFLRNSNFRWPASG